LLALPATAIGGLALLALVRLRVDVIPVIAAQRSAGW